jgi:hypothetical protein
MSSASPFFYNVSQQNINEGILAVERHATLVFQLYNTPDRIDVALAQRIVLVGLCPIRWCKFLRYSAGFA